MQDLTWRRPVEPQPPVVKTVEDGHQAALNFIAYGLGAGCGSPSVLTPTRGR